MSASSISSITGRDFPAEGSPREKLGFALKFAALASIQDDRQPWDFRLAQSYVEIIAKEDPSLAVHDPDGREAIIGSGAALMYLKLALKNFGCLGRVALFPDLGQSDLVARVHHGFCGGRDAHDKLLFEAMTASHANASRLGDPPVSEPTLALLRQAAAGERGWLDFVQNEANRRRVMDLVVAADSHRNAGDSTGDFAMPWTRFASDGRDSQPRSAATASVPQAPPLAVLMAVVKTKTDDKYGWLEAGQTVARTVLQAQASGLSWAFLSSVRRREARERLRMQIGHKGFAQVILSFGSPASVEAFFTATPDSSAAAFPKSAN